MITDARGADGCACGATYATFRTGLTFGCVRGLMWMASEDATTWRHKGRNQVLGHWREIKRRMWTSHTAECEHHARADPDGFADHYRRSA